MKVDLHWMKFRYTGTCALVVVLALVGEAGLGVTFFLLMIAAVVYFIERLRLKNTHMVFDDSKMTFTEGIFSKSVTELPFDSIKMFKTHQGKLGRILDYGRFTVVSTSGTSISIEPVATPELTRQEAVKLVRGAKKPKQNA